MATSFPAFSFRWFPMAKMYSRTATNLGLDCSCLLAWIFWIISWNTQTFPQTPGVPSLQPSCPNLPKPQQVPAPQTELCWHSHPKRSQIPSGCQNSSACCAQKGFCCLVAQISGVRGSRVWSSILPLPPSHSHQLNAVIKILSTVSPPGRIIISCAQTQNNSVFPGKPPPS